MKKLLLLLLLFVSTFTIAQTGNRLEKHVSLLEVGDWDSYNKRFNWENHEVDLEIIFHNKTIRINDKAGTTYITGDQTEDTDNSTNRVASWKAIDEKGRRCEVSIVYNKKALSKFFLALYDNMAIRWYYD